MEVCDTSIATPAPPLLPNIFPAARESLNKLLINRALLAVNVFRDNLTCDRLHDRRGNRRWREALL
jgi:hypothetical protein